MQLWERPCIVTGRNVSTLPKRNLTSVSPNFHLLLTESRLLACVLIQMYFVPCPLIHEQLHRCLQYTSHNMIHNSCDIDSRVWCCWKCYVVNKSSVGYLIGDYWCLGPLFQVSRELPGPRRPRTLFSLLYACVWASSCEMARFCGKQNIPPRYGP